MAHIALRDELPGIRGLLGHHPETAAPLSALADVPPRRSERLSRGERERIATYASTLDDRAFRAATHGAAARHLLEGGAPRVDAVRHDLRSAPVGETPRALPAGRGVDEDDVAAARRHGAPDVRIHDTVPVAAAFRMSGRCVDGPAVRAPDGPAVYERMGASRAAGGDVR
jgi:alkylhydroperoxidase family enzyme